MSFSSEYQKLNPNQKLAVDAIEGPVMVIAGPGTGKTQVLALRIANILKQTQTNPGNILALTFTESGTIAMKKRLAEIIGNTAYFVPIYTFHGFCNQIIKEYPDKFIDLRHSSSDENGEWNFTELQALSDIEKLEIFEKIIDNLNLKELRPIKAPYYYLHAAGKNIQNLKREGFSVKDFEEILIQEQKNLENLPKINEKTNKPLAAYLQKEKQLAKNLELLEIYQSYQNELGARGRFDYEDMILFVIKKLIKDAELLSFLQERFQYILIDEYQDTNNAQNELITLIMSFYQTPNLFVVGDEDQSIYRFQGANLENFLYLHKLYPNLQYIVLDENYRSSTKILDTAKTLISNNNQRVEKVLANIEKKFLAKGEFKNEKFIPKIIYAKNDSSEKFFIIQEIQKLQKEGVNLSEIAVFCRRNSDVFEMEELCKRANIDYQLEGGIDILQDNEIKKLIKLFKLIANLEEDNFLFFEVLNFDFLNLPINEVFEVISNDLSQVKNLLKLIKEEKDAPQLTLFENNSSLEKGNVRRTKEFDAITTFLKKLIFWQNLSANRTLSEFFEIIVKESGFLDFILEKDNQVELLMRLNSLFEFVKDINRSEHEINLKNFIERLGTMRKYQLTLRERTFYHKDQAVRLMTAHKAKGLEFEHVFIYKCIDTVWGNNSVRELIQLPDLNIYHKLKNKENYSNNESRNIEDERRLFYVAITRAKKSLHLTYSEKYIQNDYEKFAVPSLFLNEIENLCEKENISEIENEILEKLKLNLKDKIENNKDKSIQEFAKDKIDKFTLSVTALNTYLLCPRKFFYNNILRLPRAKPSYMAFGTAVHKALEIFFKEFQKTNFLPDLKLLTETFEKAIQKETLTLEEKNRWTKKGKEILTTYFENYKNEFKKPIFLEKFLKTYLEDIAISGKLDKIEYLDAEKRTIKVIDYKTGNQKTRNEIEGLTQNATGDLKRQIIFYKLLTDLTPGFLFDTKQCEFDFIEPKNNKFRKESFEIKIEEIEELKILIKETIVKIRNLEFLKTQDVSKCQTCEFKNICKR